METEAARHAAGATADGTTGGTTTGAGTTVLFRDDVRVEFEGESVSLTSPVTSFMLRPVRNGIRTALGRLADGPTVLSDLGEGLLPAERAQLDRFLGRAGHLIARGVLIDGRELVRIEETARDAGHRSVELSAGPADGELPLDGVIELLGHLAGAGFVDLADEEGRFTSDEDATLRQWDFHDLLQHSRIRSGRYDDAFGAVYPHAERIAPQPAVKPVPEGPVVELHRPSLEELTDRDPGLTTAIEGRRSIRQYGETPLTADQLGEFLYRVARVRAHYVPGEGMGDEVVSRPYPSGGGAYELELYLTVRRCEGLEPGVYYYDPVAHRLVLVNSDATDRESMFNVASRATGLEARPDVLITMTSRFQRLSWKYRAIAYATTLRHTGVLYQTMYLVATAMGLAPCGLGNGDADMSARVLGLDYLSESSVGDFLLGSRQDDDSVAGEPAAGWNMVNSPEWALRAGSLLP